MSRRIPAIVVALAVSVAVATAACSTGSGASGASGSATVTVSGAWARAAARTAGSAAYLTISNGAGAADSLVGVSTPAAGSASLHQTTTDDSGMTGMMHTASVPIPAGATVALEPGGYHIMLMDLPGDLVAGTTIPLTLTFEHAGPVTVTAEVRGS